MSDTPDKKPLTPAQEIAAIRRSMVDMLTPQEIAELRRKAKRAQRLLPKKWRSVGLRPRPPRVKLFRCYSDPFYYGWAEASGEALRTSRASARGKRSRFSAPRIERPAPPALP